MKRMRLLKYPKAFCTYYRFIKPLRHLLTSIPSLPSGEVLSSSLFDPLGCASADIVRSFGQIGRQSIPCATYIIEYVPRLFMHLWHGWAMASMQHR